MRPRRASIHYQTQHSPLRPTPDAETRPYVTSRRGFLAPDRSTRGRRASNTRMQSACDVVDTNHDRPLAIKCRLVKAQQHPHPIVLAQSSSLATLGLDPTFALQSCPHDNPFPVASRHGLLQVPRLVVGQWFLDCTIMQVIAATLFKAAPALCESTSKGSVDTPRPVQVSRTDRLCSRTNRCHRRLEIDESPS